MKRETTMMDIYTAATPKGHPVSIARMLSHAMRLCELRR